MASLTGNLVAETYKALLKTIDNDILTASEKQITDGLGGGSNVFIDSNGFLRANKYKVTNGLATQFLKADGSLDANSYLTSITGAQVITALGFTPVTNARTLTINGTTYDLTANRSWTVAGTAAVWGNITGTLSNQTDLQNALNAKFNNPTGTISQYIRGDGSLATFPTLPGGLPTGGTAGQILAKIDATDYNAHWIDNFATQTKNEVKLGATLAKGTAVYVSGSTGGSGTNMIVMAASNASEALSSKTFGLLETGGATNDFVKCVTFGLIAGLDTSTAQAGDPVWLGVNGALLFGVANKPVAPANMVYIGVVTRVQSNNGEIFVNVQNGFEIEELHDVLIQSKANNQGLFYESATGLWKNKSIATVLGYTPQAQLNGTGFVKASGTTISYDNSTYLTTADAASTYQLLTNLSTDLTASATKYPSVNAVIAGLATKQNQLNGTGLVRMAGTTVSYDNNSYITGSGSVGYISSWNATTGLTNSSLFESSGSIGLNITNVNYSAYGRAFTGASFAASSFGYEIASGATADGGLLGGLAYVLISNDASRRIGAKIESNVVGTTATNLGANLRFYVKADNAAIAEIARMTASGVTFYSGITATSFVKTGGTSNEYLRADGSVNVITGDIVSGSGTAGYIAKFNSSAVIASSNLFESAANIGFGTITLNYGSYGRAFTGAGFGSTAFGFEAVTGSTTNGGLIGGLSLVIASNDSTRRIGSAIQSYISGATSTHQGADLRFFVKPDNGVLLEVVRMTSAGITFNKDLTAANITATTFVKSGGLSTQFLMADGSVSTYTNPVTGTGSSGYIPKWTSASNLGSSFMYDDGTSIGIAYTTPNKGGYGRALSGAAFGSASFGFEAVSNTTTNGGLIGGLSFIVNQNDSSRIVGSAIQSNLVGTTATNYGADLRFFAKADGVFTIGEVVRMTSAGLRVYGTIVKDGGTSSQYLMADGSVSTGPNLAAYLPLAGGTMTGVITTPNSTFGIIIGDDSRLADRNIANTLFLEGVQNNDRGYINFSDTIGNALGAINGGALTWRGVAVATTANISGTTNYISKFTSANVIGNSQIFDDGTRVFINATTAPGFGSPKFFVKMATANSYEGILVASSSNDNAVAIAHTGTQGLITTNYGGSGANTTLSFGTNGVQQMNLFTTGNLGIGVNNTDSGFKLDVNGTGRISGNTLLNSKVLINTSDTNKTPLLLNAEGNYSLSGNMTNGFAITNTSFGRALNMGIFESGAYAWIQGAYINNADVTFTLSLQPRGGNVAIGTTSASGTYGKLSVAGGISIINDNNAKLEIGRYSAGANNSYIKLGANSNSLRITNNTDAADIFIIENGGKVGIGTMSPAALTEINSGSIANGGTAKFALALRSGTTTYCDIYQGYNSTIAGQSMFGTTIQSSDGLAFATSNIERIRITIGGNILIGTVSDTGFKLNVNGTGRFSNHLISNSPGGGVNAATFYDRTGAVGAEVDQYGGLNAYSGILNNNGNYGSGSSGTPLVFKSGAVQQFSVSATNMAVVGSVTATSFFESSDIRLKQLIDGSAQIAGIENLEAKLYEKNGKIELGYFAQDAEKLMPYAVTKNADGFLNLSYREVHTAKIARLEQRVAELEKQLNLN